MTISKARLIRPDSVVGLSSEQPVALLQKTSLRRAIVDHIINVGGSATAQAINEHFKFDCRKHLNSLVRTKWLAVKEAQQ